MGLGDRCTHVRSYQPEKIDSRFAHVTDRAKKNPYKVSIEFFVGPVRLIIVKKLLRSLSL